MKWPVKPLPKEGDLRNRKAFLFLPMTIDKETRWLEFAEWAEICRVQWHRHGRTNLQELEWEPISWRGK